MNDYIETYLKRVKGLKSEGTYKSYKSHLKQFDHWVTEGGYDIREIDPLELELLFIGMRDDGYAPNTISVRFEAIRGFYKFLSEKKGEIEENPMESLEKSEYVEKGTKKHGSTEVVYITPEEKEKLCKNVPKPTLRNELIVRTMWQTGVRKSELVEIELSDLDRDDRSIEIWSPKTSEWRTVFYQPSLDLLMDQWLDGGYRNSYVPSDDSDYLFVSERVEKLSPHTVNRYIIKEAAENAGIQEVMYEDMSGNQRYRVTAHALRHGHGVYALKSGIDVRTVQKHLGHSKLEMTMRYLQLLDDDIKEGYRRFGTDSDE
jgi:integrase/recombinase XerD